MPEQPAAVVGLGLKMYLSRARTLAWADALVERVADHEAVRTGRIELFVLPDYVNLVDVGERLRGTGIHVGAQDVSPAEHGPHTGDVAASTLRDVGCRYVEVGHAERRRDHHEGDDLIARKARAAARAGVTPIVCIGERDPAGVEAAIDACQGQLGPVLDLLGPATEQLRAPVVIAYEPEWAIGAERPAGPEHIIEVVRSLRTFARDRAVPVRILYGGSAGPGSVGPLWPDVDGPFLGRSGHDPSNLLAVLDELVDRMEARR